MKQMSGRLWRNWSGIASGRPETVVYPDSIEQVASVVRSCAERGAKLRVVGSGHSFTALVPTDQVLMSLDAMQGVIQIDRERGLAEVWAGTKLKRLGEELLSLGWAQENLGDINHQSVAGAISTGTHGTGVGFGSIATQVAGITIVTADGSVVECSEESNPSLFKAMQVSLGALGVIVKVWLRVVPAWRMHFQSMRVSFAECMDRLPEWKANNRHFEFYLFPYSDEVQVKLMNVTEDQPSSNSWWNNANRMVMENGAFYLLSEACRLFPSFTRAASRISAKGVPVYTQVGYSSRMFATPRLVRFNEMEYNIPSEQMRTVLEEVRSCIERRRFKVHFPIECRFVRSDDIWLSPAHGRESAYVAVHMYKGMPHEDYFAALEEIFLNHGGRPHWGKLHTLTEARLSERYPRWHDFKRMRAELDPNGMFLNDYLQKLFFS